MRSNSTPRLLLVAALGALATLAAVTCSRGPGVPVAAQGLGRSGAAGAAGLDAASSSVQLVAVEGSPAARAELAPTAAPPAEASARRTDTSVSVLVRRADERLAAPGVEGVAVSFVGADHARAAGSRLGVTDARGELCAALPGPGRYELFIDPSDVPDGLVAPGRFLVPAPSAPGVAATVVQAARGAEARAVLFLNDARVLAGRVSGAAGQGLAGVVVRAAATARGHQRVTYDLETGDAGEFELCAALPLEYVLRVVDLGAHADALRALPLPPPQLADLRPGDVRGIALHVAAGRHLIVGTLVDERGAPFQGIDLIAYYGGLDTGSAGPGAGRFETTWSDLVGTAVSDARGRFELGPVHSADLRIVVAARAASAAGRGVRLVAFGVDALDVALDAASPSRIEVGRIELTRSRTYSVSGTIALAPSASSATPKLSKLEVTGAPFGPRPAHAGRFGVQARPHVTFDPATGAFELSCDGWHERVELVVAWRGQPSTAKRFEFIPEPDGARTGVELTFP